MKNYLKFILFILPFSFWSCTQEKYLDEVNKSYQFSIQDAKLWYETQISTGIKSLKKIKGEGIDNQIQPYFNWGKAELSCDTLCTVVELPLEYSNGSVIIAKSDGKRPVETNDTLTKQILKLVIMQNLKTGKTYGFKMAIIPSLDYLLKFKKDFGTNTYLHRDSKLEGLVLFYSLSDNSFVNGWRYSNGKVTGKLKLQCQNSSYHTTMKKSAAVPVEVIEVCYFYKVECGGLVSYHEDCNTIYVYSDGDTTGGSSDAGGYYDTGADTGDTDHAGSTGTVTTTSRKGDLPEKKPKSEDVKTNCNDALTLIKNAFASNYQNFSNYNGMLEGDLTQPSFQDYLNKIRNDPNNEYSIDWNYNNGLNYTTRILTGNEKDVKIAVGIITIANLHNHPGPYPPSPKDLHTLLGTAFDYYNYRTLYTLTSNGTVYALEVTDRGKLTTFWNTYGSSMTIDPATNSFTKKTEFYDNWDNAQKNFAKLGETCAWEYTIAYLLAKYDMGVSFSKKTASDSGFTVQYLQKNEATGKFELMKCK